MGTSIAIGAAISSVLLLFALACAVVAQASHTWWVIKSTSNTNEYYFGLYRFCWDVNGINETCYRFDSKDISALMTDTIGADASKLKILEPETDESKIVWILSFVSIILVGISAFTSTFALFQAISGKAIFLTICAQSIITFIALVLQITCLAYAADKREDIWPEGVAFLEIHGSGTGRVDAEGFGLMFQMISTAATAIPYAVYLILLLPSRRLQTERLQRK